MYKIFTLQSIKRLIRNAVIFRNQWHSVLRRTYRDGFSQTNANIFTFAWVMCEKLRTNSHVNHVGMQKDKTSEKPRKRKGKEKRDEERKRKRGISTLKLIKYES